MNGEQYTITKSDLYVYTEAPLHLWALKHKQASPKAPSAFEQILMEQGQQVEQIARQFLEDHLQGYEITFQAELNHGPYHARLDALAYDPQKQVYDIYEIKSSTRVKTEALEDLTFQALVAEGSGLPLRNCYLVLVNSDYVFDNSLELTKFFSIHDVTEDIRKLKPKIAKLREAALQAVKQTSPQNLEACCKPQQCITPHLCHPDLPEYPIYDIPNLRAKKAQELRAQGHIAIHSIPPSFPLTENQQAYVDVVRSNAPLINHTSIQTQLNQLAFPLYFLDYETFGPAVPFFPGFSPYQHITFQFSVHVLHSPGQALNHFEYLNTQLQDPSEALATQLSQAIGPNGSVVVWNRTFEHTRNKELAARLPHYAEFFTSLNDRMFDLMEIFSKNSYIHPGCHGSASIKKVLPVLCPDTDQSYAQLEINKGDQAMAAWLHVTSGQLAPDEAEHIRTQMYAYCKLDTLAMYKIWEHLHQTTCTRPS